MIVLLLLWSYDCQQEFEWLEYFAGTGHLSAVMAAAQYRSIRFDLLDNDKPHHRRSNFMNLAHPSGFALATLFMLRTVEGDFGCHLGLKCSSFCKMNVGTSARSACAAIGWEPYESVSLGNMLLERSCLLIYLATCLGGVWSLEQPAGALTEYYPAFRETVQNIFECGGPTAVQCVRWWMGHYKAPTPKRHYAYSNSPAIKRIDKGVLQGWKQKGKAKNKPVEHYVDSKGRKRIYPVPFAREVCDLMELMKKTRLGQPELPAVLPDALETFGNLQVADPLVWRKVNLPSVYNYLRRNKKLNIPVEWQHVMPKKIG
ncbi:unnamed protein product [Cladocopium goreaui]|uniref:Palmitoyl-monogalactosyldiacylglycerol delta-7 desaturase, chloroplastic n=1 Tax=Cladocopium goreaui TaxID=2562237 RepID=A0A9P1FI69_9DINO|nr:unnamed protein product [Cladocopium goreaui]